VTSTGLKWVCSGDYVARQCLQYRGVVPVCADAKFGRQDGAVLTSALRVVRTWVSFTGYRAPPPY
jgi:pyruvate kinase